MGNAKNKIQIFLMTWNLTKVGPFGLTPREQTPCTQPPTCQNCEWGNTIISILVPPKQKIQDYKTNCPSNVILLDYTDGKRSNVMVLSLQSPNIK